jgi:hypothetical protein
VKPDLSPNVSLLASSNRKQQLFIFLQVLSNNAPQSLGEAGGGGKADNITRTSIKLRPASSTMVCAKCQKKLKSTELATPGVKRKNDMYYGSPSTTLGGSSAAGAAKGKSTLGNTGIGKVCFFALLEYSATVRSHNMANLTVEQTS